MFKNLFEAPEAEAARLATAPVSSINHSLSMLPVNINVYVQDLMIQLPRLSADDTRTVIVVPFDPVKLSEAEIAAQQELPRKRHIGWWNCLVVASDHPSYPVGGYRLSVPEAQLVRGTQRTFDLAPTSPVIDEAELEAAWSAFDALGGGETDERAAFRAGAIAGTRMAAPLHES